MDKAIGNLTVPLGQLREEVLVSCGHTVTVCNATYPVTVRPAAGNTVDNEISLGVRMFAFIGESE